MEYTKKYVDLKNGERYAYIDKGEGEVVVILHGNMSSSVGMLPVIDNLKDQYRCVAPDMRGYGDSSYNSGFRSLKELAEDVIQFMDALNIEKAHLIGWSTGTPVTLELAAAHPERLKTLFGIEGVSHAGYFLFKKDEKGMPIPNAVYSSYEEMAADTKNYPFHTFFTSGRLDKIRKLWETLLYIHARPSEEDFQVIIAENAKERCQNDINWAWSHENMSDKDNAYAKGENTIKNVKCPCAFTTGSDDMLVTRKMVLQNYNAIKGAKLLEYEHSGHVPLIDCLDRLIADIKENLKRA